MSGFQICDAPWLLIGQPPPLLASHCWREGSLGASHWWAGHSKQGAFVLVTKMSGGHRTLSTQSDNWQSIMLKGLTLFAFILAILCPCRISHRIFLPVSPLRSFLFHGTLLNHSYLSVFNVWRSE